LQFLNEGGALVGELEYALIDDEGATHSGRIGPLAPGAEATVEARVQIDDANVRCVWLCVDVKGRWHVWARYGRLTADLRRSYERKTHALPHEPTVRCASGPLAPTGGPIPDPSSDSAPDQAASQLGRAPARTAEPHA
jgi:hypothetical protein